jgi:c-di-GMP-binding flagellar brake protein YcgR
MSLTEIEAKVLKTCCELNDNLTVSIREDNHISTYKSRFLDIDFKKGYLIIDEPSAESHEAKPISKGQYIEIFFGFKTFRYLFDTKVLDHVMFKLNDNEFHAFKISLPKHLKDGDKREYFRVEVGLKKPILVRFNIFKRGGDKPLMSIVMKGRPEEYRCEMVDISGGGLSMRIRSGDKVLPLSRGDIVNTRFKLKAGDPEILLWCTVKNARRFRDTNILVWGLEFMGKDRNKNLNFIRNKIMRHVVECQRELLSK